MSSREEQWNEIKQEYHTHSMTEKQLEQMKQSIRKAKKENRHVFRNIAAAAAVIAVIISILPNTSGSIAYAMSRIPILSKWVEAVTFREYQYDNGRNSADIKVPELIPQATEELDSRTQENVRKTAEEINAEIQAITDKLIREFEENLKQEEGYQSMQVQSETIATTQKYFTLKLICFQSAGSGAEWDYFYTIDLESGERLQLKDLFLEGSDYITIISENIISQMKAQMAEDEMISYWVESDIPEWDFKEITDETQFYLNENGELVISFNEGDVAPMYMGCVEFVIPEEVLKDIRIQ